MEFSQGAVDQQNPGVRSKPSKRRRASMTDLQSFASQDSDHSAGLSGRSCSCSCTAGASGIGLPACLACKARSEQRFFQTEVANSHSRLQPEYYNGGGFACVSDILKGAFQGTECPAQDVRTARLPPSVLCLCSLQLKLKSISMAAILSHKR